MAQQVWSVQLARQSILRPRVAVLLPHDAFQEHAAHRAEWSAQLSSKRSERTCIRSGLATFLRDAFTAHSDLVVRSQVTDIIDLILQLIGHPNGVHRPCRNRKSRGVVLSTSEGQWATTKFDGVWNYPLSRGTRP